MIRDKLIQRRDIILKKWGEGNLGRFTSGNIKLPGNKDDRFGNPVVYTISKGFEIILDELTADIHTAKLDEAMESIIKIKSLQVDKPSDAIGFLLNLKEILNNEWGSLTMDKDLSGDAEKLNSDIDNLILSAFDIFMECRERLYEIRSKEVLMRSYRLQERANKISPSPRRQGEDDDEIR